MLSAENALSPVLHAHVYTRLLLSCWTYEQIAFAKLRGLCTLLLPSYTIAIV